MYTITWPVEARNQNNELISPAKLTVYKAGTVEKAKIFNGSNGQLLSNPTVSNTGIFDIGVESQNQFYDFKIESLTGVLISETVAKATVSPTVQIHEIFTDDTISGKGSESYPLGVIPGNIIDNKTIYVNGDNNLYVNSAIFNYKGTDKIWVNNDTRYIGHEETSAGFISYDIPLDYGGEFSLYRDYHDSYGHVTQTVEFNYTLPEEPGQGSPQYSKYQFKGYTQDGVGWPGPIQFIAGSGINFQSTNSAFTINAELMGKADYVKIADPAQDKNNMTLGNVYDNYLESVRLATKSYVDTADGNILHNYTVQKDSEINTLPESVTYRKYLGPIDGTNVSTDYPIPIATSAQTGLISKDDLIKLNQLIIKVQNLEAKGLAVGDAGTDPVAADTLTSFYTGQTGNAPVDGSVVINTNSTNYIEYIYANGTWTDMGAFHDDPIATNTTLGIVQGEATTPGYIYVNGNGTMQMNGYDTITANVNNISSTVYNYSANWNNTYSAVSNNSANWNSTYNTYSTNSASYLTSINLPNSANWDSVYNTYYNNSASYLTSIPSATYWNSNYETVCANSANWGAGAVGDFMEWKNFDRNSDTVTISNTIGTRYSNIYIPQGTTVGANVWNSWPHGFVSAGTGAASGTYKTKVDAYITNNRLRNAQTRFTINGDTYWIRQGDFYKEGSFNGHTYMHLNTDSKYTGAFGLRPVLRVLGQNINLTGIISDTYGVSYNFSVVDYGDSVDVIVNRTDNNTLINYSLPGFHTFGFQVWKNTTRREICLYLNMYLDYEQYPKTYTLKLAIVGADQTYPKNISDHYEDRTTIDAYALWYSDDPIVVPESGFVQIPTYTYWWDADCQVENADWMSSYQGP
jgi:hypothetical protein